ncbi:ArsR family transcriptional regulator (plasmid) [Streptomyces sp. NBC_00271]
MQQISTALGLHTNTVRFHLARLKQDDQLREEQATAVGPGRPSMAYTAAPAAGSEAGEGYQLLAEILAGHLASTSPEPEAASIEAGREWGRFLAERRAPFSHATREEGLGQVQALLARLGFHPEVQEEDNRILLHNCPFRELADDRPGIVCSIHLGLMRGALSEIGAPVEVTHLQRFEAPHPCIAELSSSQEQGERDAPG